jgi:hypothetical protein
MASQYAEYGVAGWRWLLDDHGNCLSSTFIAPLDDFGSHSSFTTEKVNHHLVSDLAILFAMAPFALDWDSDPKSPPVLADS